MTVKEILDAVYSAYHKPEYIYPDPLSPVRGYTLAADREVAGLIASSLAVGRVELILKAVDQVLSPLGEHPADMLKSLSLQDLQHIYSTFVYRFFKSREISSFLSAIGEALRTYGSLEALFMEHHICGRTVVDGIRGFCSFIMKASDGNAGILVTPPEKGSACKRLNLYLRWMVRHDSVDPGGWEHVSPADLLVPVDTHMFDLATRMHFTSRKAGDLRTASEITEAFRAFSPDDPVRYDFSLTRLGIHPDLDKSIFDRLTF